MESYCSPCFSWRWLLGHGKAMEGCLRLARPGQAREEKDVEPLLSNWASDILR